MNASTQESPAPALSQPQRESSSLPAWWRLAPFAALWVLACLGLSVHWELNPQYHFGWFVPIFAAYTALHRWRTRPPPGSPLRAGLWLATACGLLLLPAWLVSRPNPDWRFLNWFFAGLVATIQLGAIAAAGGRPWLRHFAMPVALFFTAVPWPDVIENPFTQWMMRNVAAVAVTLLDLVGVGAIQHGNLIEVATGVVGVDEACSGIRSLQGSLMASLVLGELFRFNVSRRVILVVASIAAAFITNVLRASFLAWNAARDGLGAVDRWHDPAGMTILLICVGIILAIALFLDRNAASPPAWARVPTATTLPAWFLPGLCGWLVLSVAAVELWYYDPATPPQKPWHLAAPANSTAVDIPVKVRAIYHADEEMGVKWTHRDGTHWLLYNFEWKYGPASSRVAAMGHSPDVCLPASGRELNEDRGEMLIPVNGTPLPFHAFSFRDGSRLLFVYYAIWQYRSERGQQHGPRSVYKGVANMQTVFWREARLGQQVTEVIAAGYWDAAHADAAFRELAPKIVQPR